MASTLLSDALSGFQAETTDHVKEEEEKQEQAQVQHKARIGALKDKTVKLQREMRGRRNKPILADLKETVDLLTAFQDAQWPPKQVPAPPEWMRSSDGKNSDSRLEVLEGAMELVVKAEEEATASAAAAIAAVESEISVSETDDSSAVSLATTATTEVATDDGSSSTPPLPPATVSPREDDPLTRLHVPEAIEKALRTYAAIMVHPGKTNKAVELALDCTCSLIKNRYVSGRAGGKGDTSGSGSAAMNAKQEEGAATDRLPPPSLLHTVLEGITKCSESNIEGIQVGVVKNMLAILTSPQCGVHEASLLMAVRATFHVYLITKSQNCKQQAQNALLDMLRSVYNRMEAYDVMSHNIAENNGSSNAAVPAAIQEAAGNGHKTDTTDKMAAFASQFHTDSYLLFRALCKLSSKPLPGDDGAGPKPPTTTTSMLTNFVTSAPTVDPLAVNSKILSLQLILAVLEFSGEAFCTGEKFIYAVRHYLCVSLLKNCMSARAQVAFLSQKIFLLLVNKFKTHLKSEIEVFLSNIFLRVLDSPNSSFEQKAVVVESLRSLCSDPVLLTQIFLNYDCDFDAVNLYKDIVHNLTKLSGKSTAMPSGSLTKKEMEQEFELSLGGTEVLVTILRAFLRALGLPGGNDVSGEDNASARLQSLLQLDVGLAVTAPSAEEKKKPITPKASAVDLDDLSVSSKDSKLSAENGSVSAGLAGKIVESFELKRNAEQNFELGTVKFTLSLKTGIKYFVENQFVELDAQKIAQFFLANKDKLDKTQMGEALGREPDAKFIAGEEDPEKGGPGFFVRILHHYVDELDFMGLPFDDAIRLFLSGFRLPGEAQKIDRIMEKFAERFTRQNLDVFPSADTAFILAFSVIMLNTDLHNPSIKPEKRMTVESFIRNNRGISVDGGDLPDEFLTGIFTRIQSNPFSLKEDDDARERAGQKQVAMDAFEGSSFFGASAEDRKREKFRQEREVMMAATEKLFKARPGRSKAEKTSQASSINSTDFVAPADVAKPMFDVTWGPLIGTLSQVLECSTDERSIAACLNGFVYAVRIAAHSNMSLARDTFVNSLAKFTFLGSIKEMKVKNIESIRTLLSIAVIDGEYLGESWGPVLQCISQLARLRLLSSGLDGDESFLTEKEQSKKKIEEDLLQGAGLFRQPTKAEISRELEENNGRAVLEAVNEVLIDKVFTSTVKLSATSLTHFIEQLVAVSAMEVAGEAKSGISGMGMSTRLLRTDSGTPKATHGEDGPRIFCLQRLVEVADYNMDVRPRLAWAQVWDIMAEHFSKIGCHENAMVSIFAIDSLKQLSFKFLQKPELSEFNFQAIFLRPFLQIIENKGTREDIRELILRVVDNMIRTISHNLRSGWKIFFSILTLSASDSSQRINTLGLAILQRLLDEHLHQLCRLTDGDENFVDADVVGREMNALEIRNRNANVEDFVGLCRASLSFVQTNQTTSPIPIGLSMRALCHTACYADLLADHRVLPPVSGAQSSDPHAPGYTYAGLSEKEALEMVLWRPLLDGLAEGVRSTFPSISGGVGCLVQRGSVLALRAILLRHGHVFSSEQWSVILKQTLLPSIQVAAESDVSPVIRITSETPFISNLDFLAESPRLPPPNDDEGLTKFAERAQSEESAPSRPLGRAELMVEASFADMRHGGDGDLSLAYELGKTDEEDGFSEQPFPDSWVATTAPIALGLLTDITSEIFLRRGEEGREILWPIVLEQLKLWAIGRPELQKDGPVTDADFIHDDAGVSWQPCEALIRTSCREFKRLSARFFEIISELDKEDGVAWNDSICKSIGDTLDTVVTIEGGIGEELVRLKLDAYGIVEGETKGEARLPTEKVTSPIAPASGPVPASPTRGMGMEDVDVIIYTPYGKGHLVKKRADTFKAADGSTMTINEIKLDSGASVFRPAPERPANTEISAEEEVVADVKLGNGTPDGSETRRHKRETYWEKLLPQLKIRCVTAFCLQQSLFEVLDSFVGLASKEVASSLLDALNNSRITAHQASGNEDLAHIFQEEMFSQWGDGVEEVEEALTAGRLAQRRGSAAFFLSQEAGASKNIIRMLSVLFQSKNLNDASWDRESFAEPLLLERITEVLDRFLESEKRDGHHIDPNVWRNASESGGKLAIYCTSFAGVVVGILNVMVSIDAAQFARHTQEFFPVLCVLVRVQSSEIRQLVHTILARQIAPMLNVNMDVQAKP